MVWRVEMEDLFDRWSSWPLSLSLQPHIPHRSSFHTISQYDAHLYIYIYNIICCELRRCCCVCMVF
jgi:hypothetical protein